MAVLILNSVSERLSMEKSIYDPQKTLRQLRLIGILEGISYLVLLGIAMPMKYLMGDPEWVKKVGMLHGILFVLYILLLMLAKFQLHISWLKSFWIFCLSLLPFGTFFADVKFLKGYSV